ncbi:Unconventional myosin-Va, partial [Halocaridina rubra]
EPDGKYVLHQLKACGVIETVCISQAGYPVRISYDEFVMRYGQLGTDPIAATKEIAVSVLGDLDGILDFSKCRFGYTRVFLSESSLHTLERVREEKRSRAAVCLQKYWRGHKCVCQYTLKRSAVLFLQKHIRTWAIRQNYKKIKNACLLIQRNIRKMIAKKRYIDLCQAAVTIQKYYRGWIARRKYETLLRQNVARPFSSQSVMSMNSLGYYSLTTSASGYSLTPSLHDMSPSGNFFDMAAFALSSDALKSYLSPEHHKRMLETEESGIETDTESINGDANHPRKRKSRKQRRKHLQQLLKSRVYAGLLRTGSDDSLDEHSSNLVSMSSGIESSSCHLDTALDLKNRLQEESYLISTKTSKNVLFPKIEIKSEDELPSNKFDLNECGAVPKLRVTTMRSLDEWSGLLKDYSPLENLQMVLPKQNLSLFFKDGVLSYRRMPV